jgi:uncharacterized protein
MQLPFSGAAPSILTGAAGASFYYAYNLDNPGGIKLLNSAAHGRLVAHLACGPDIPDLAAIETEEDRALYDHGIAKLRHAYKRADMPSQGKSLGIWLNVADACNLNCFYCYIPELRKRVAPQDISITKFSIDSDTIDLVVQRLVDYCSQNQIAKVHIKFAGGEPTLAIEQVQRFCRLFRAARPNLSVSFGMLTNGVFDPAIVLPVIREHRIGVSISIDGMRDNHDRIRYSSVEGGRRVGTWERIQRNIASLLQAGVRPYFLYTITPKNLGDVEPFAAFVHSLGCGFRLSLERGNRVIGHDTQLKTADALTSFYQRLAESAPLTVRFDRDAKFSEWTLDRKKSAACSTCRGYMAIGRDGGVASCQMRLNEPVGNLRKESVDGCVAGFDDDVRTRLLKHPEQKAGACTRCEYRYVCAGGCPQHTRDVYADFDRPSPWCHVYGSLVRPYIDASARHLARRAESAITRPDTANR